MSEEDLGEYPNAIPEHVKPFNDMVDRLLRNAETDFGGAMVVVPPVGKPIVFTLLDPGRDLEHFLSSAKTKIEIALAEYQQTQMAMNGLRGGRF